jgi:hypothetical protein
MQGVYFEATSVADSLACVFWVPGWGFDRFQLSGLLWFCSLFPWSTTSFALLSLEMKWKRSDEQK